MKKEAWPWIGSTESEMGSMAPTGDPVRDIQNDPYEGYDMLSPVKHIHDGTPPESGSEGMRYTTEIDFSDMQDDELSAIKDMLKHIRDCIEEDMTIVTAGKFGNKCSRAFLDKRVNIIGLHKESESIGSNIKIRKDSGSLMFHKFPAKLNGFVVDLSNASGEEISISIENMSKQASYGCSGVIVSSPKLKLENILSKFNFDVIKKHCGVLDKYLVSSNKISGVAVARYYGKSSKKEASFICDIADTPEKKIDGLQVYSKLKKECGLLFPYKRPTDVMFHMGSVSYPIDIIFIDSDNNIKKICKNIQPGALGVFGASGISNVLEISGGLCDLLDIEEGGKLYITRGEAYSGDILKAGSILSSLDVSGVAFKHAKEQRSSAYSVGNKKIIKLGADKSPSVVSLLNKFASRGLDSRKRALSIDIDEYLSSLGSIRLYQSSAPEVEKRVYSGFYNETFSIKKDSYIDIPASDFFKKGFYKSLNNKFSYVTKESLVNGFKDEHKKLFKKVCSNNGRDIIVVSRGDLDKDMIETFLEKAIKSTLNTDISISSRQLRIPHNFGSKAAYEAVSEKYGEADLYAYSFLKEGGMPVPKGVKDKARSALKYLATADDLCIALKENFTKNMEAYDKISGDTETIKSSKGKYNQSCKRNSRKTKRMLLNIKSGIQILNEIRDISTTSEVIGSIAEAAKVSSESIRSVLDLVSVIDSDDFVERLSADTGKASSSLEDCSLALQRAKEYINSNILGILVLTE